VWVIPKIMPQVIKEFPSLLGCKGWREILGNNNVSIISIARTLSQSYLYCSQLFIWKTIINRNMNKKMFSNLDKLSAIEFLAPFLSVICKSNLVKATPI
jgi:hypothetical protein